MFICRWPFCVNDLGELLKVKWCEMNWWWNWGPDLSETGIWKLCSSLEDSHRWMVWTFCLLKTRCTYYSHCLCLPRISCFSLQEYSSSEEPSVGCLSKNSLFFLLIWNDSFSYCLAPCYLVFRISLLPSFNSNSFPASISGLYHMNALAVFSRIFDAFHD